MKLSDFSIRRSVTTTMLIFLVIIFGFVSLSRLNIDLFPDIVFPGAVIMTSYTGVGSEEIENLITEPIESSISTVEGVKSIDSTSAMGQSSVVVEFEWGRDMDFAVQDLREQIDLISSSVLPDDADESLIFKFDPSMMPVMIYGVGSQDMKLADLKQEIEDVIQPRLERLAGVAQVNLRGGQDREIIVLLHRDRLNYYGVDFDTINGILARENINLSGGEIVRGNKNLLIRTVGKFKTLDDIRKINIPVASGGLVKLSDLGEVKDGFEDVETIARTNQARGMGLLIQKQTDANTVEVCNTIRDEMEEIEQEYNGQLNIALSMDQSEFIQKSINNVAQNALIGGLLAVIILLLFLRNIRSTIVISTAIPISIIATFVMMYFADLNLNVISLGGLALGVGMLVDNAIVVLENIYRYRSLGKSKMEAAHRGSTEVGMAIVASTLTTLAVFLPILFVEGLAARLFRDLAFTVGFSLTASLLVALTWIPMLSSKILKIKQKEQDRQQQDSRIIKIYRNLLSTALKHRWIIVAILIIAFAASLALVPLIGFEFMPSSDRGSFTINYDLPVGTTLSESDKVAKKVESVLKGIPEVENIFTNVGAGDMMSTSSSSHTGSINVNLVDSDQRERSTQDVIEELRGKLEIPDVKLIFSTQSGMSSGKPVNIKLKGDDLDLLKEYSTLAAVEMEKIEGLREIEDSFQEGRPELQIMIDRSLASQFNLNASQVANALRTAVDGDVTTEYEVAGDEYDIRLRLAESDIDSITKLANLNIITGNGTQVPLQRFAKLNTAQGPNEILRIDEQRYAEITADLYNTDLGSVMGEIRERLNNNITLPDGYEFSFEGEYEDMQESFGALGMAMILAIVLVYMVMASQFESLIHPFVIMFTIPLALIGVLFGLYISKSILSVASLIGVITLVGIVVNNGIVLVDYINTLRDSGKAKIEAIIEAGVTRIRPIMMTALTTILGMLPLALGIGEGAELSQPMGIVIVSGLSFATLLTLFVVPIFYSLMTDFRNIIMNKIRGREDSETSKNI